MYVLKGGDRERRQDPVPGWRRIYHRGFFSLYQPSSLSFASALYGQLFASAASRYQWHYEACRSHVKATLSPVPESRSDRWRFIEKLHASPSYISDRDLLLIISDMIWCRRNKIPKFQNPQNRRNASSQSGNLPRRTDVPQHVCLSCVKTPHSVSISTQNQTLWIYRTWKDLTVE